MTAAELTHRWSELEGRYPNTAFSVVENVEDALGYPFPASYQDGYEPFLRAAIAQLANLADAGEAS